MLDLGFRALEVEREFTEYLTGKSVAIVYKLAEKESWRDHKMGERIDSHDVVVHVHDPSYANWPECCTDYGGSRFIPEHAVEYVGSRCDVFYNNFISWPHEYDKYVPMLDVFKDQGGKFMCVESSVMAAKNFHFFAKHHDRIWVRTFNNDDHRHMVHRFGLRNLLSGTRVVVDILTKPVKSATIFALPCFVSYETPNGRASDDVPDSKFDFNLLRDWHNRFDDLDVDPVMKDLFENIP